MGHKLYPAAEDSLRASPPDVPSPVNLQDMQDAKAWEQTAMQRPFRKEFFSAICTEIGALHKPGLHILELGSGPGFLAEHILFQFQGLHYTLLDFSAAMHELASHRLSNLAGNTVQYLERNFKEDGWTESIEPVQVIVTNQAIHELRHKRYAPEFFAHVRDLLVPGGVLLFCDHYVGEDGMSNDQLYMSRMEQHQTLESSGYSVSEILVKGGRALYKALPNQ